MMNMGLSRRALHGIARYRASRWHEQHQGCCRFTPTCSAYADQAIRQRAFPVAVLLVVWRMLRCTPLTPLGTHDPVRPRTLPLRKVVGVLALSAISTALVAGAASAAATSALPRDPLATPGGCDLAVGGRVWNTLGSDHPLQVFKGQRIVVTGIAPSGVGRAGDLAATTTTTVNFIEKIATVDFTDHTTGVDFQQSVNVDKYLKYGAGIYRVDLHSTAPGAWDCTATFYVELNGSKLAGEIGILLGATGALGAVGASAGGKPERDPVPDDRGLLDPTATPEQVDEQQKPFKDRAVNTRNDAAFGCTLALLFAVWAGTYGKAIGAAIPVAGAAGDGRRRVYVRGHAVLGFISGLFAGIGLAVAGQQFGLFPLTVWTAIVYPAAAAVLGGFRAWFGRAWRV